MTEDPRCAAWYITGGPKYSAKLIRGGPYVVRVVNYRGSQVVSEVD